MRVWTFLLVAAFGLAACATAPPKPQGIFDLSNGLTPGDHPAVMADPAPPSDPNGTPQSSFRSGAGTGNGAGNAFGGPGTN